MSDRDRLRVLWVRWTLAIAGAMVVGGFLAASFVAARYEARLGRIARETSALRERLHREETVLAQRAAAAEGVVELLRDTRTRIITLSGRGPGANARGRVIWNDRSGGYVFVSNLPPAPAGRTYTLWLITESRPTPSGALQVDAEGRATHRLAAGDSRVEAFAVTLEPAGEARVPTGPTLLSSQ